MKNFEVTSVEDGKKYWISRSVAVSGFVFRLRNNTIEVLANKRGKGCSDHVGLWNCPCGYLDWNEDATQAIAREIKEECNLDVELSFLKPFAVVTEPDNYNQNVTIRFNALLNSKCNTEISVGNTGEKDEVEEVAWIPLSDVALYDWAFNHDQVIASIATIIIDKMWKEYNKIKN